MKLILFQNVQNAMYVLKMQKKLQNIAAVLDNCIRTDNGKLFLLWWRYSLFAVNVLISSPKISNLIKFCVESITDAGLPSKHKMRVSIPDMFKYNKTVSFFFKFVSPILNIGFLQNFPF